ncbi:MAG: cysteine dioxygenase [Planctomycetota bacterium]
MTQQPLDALCTKLQGEFRRDPKGARAHQLLADYAQKSQDWSEYQTWSDAGYTRNLVHRCGEFELLLLCWDKGQASPIHDHSGQNCWMAVLEGTLEEAHFVDGEPGSGLASGRVRSLGAGEVAFIQDEIAWHRIRPLGDSRSISLHLYANPIDSCRIFDDVSGEPCSIDLGYHSVRGEVCADLSPEVVRAEFS